MASSSISTAERRAIPFSVTDERKVKNLCDLYEIVRVTDALESAYNNGVISSKY
mgnify:CR=1 FL=1|jgi:hypothetical protein